jgi:hypothetical protein
MAVYANCGWYARVQDQLEHIELAGTEPRTNSFANWSGKYLYANRVLPEAAGNSVRTSTDRVSRV